MNGVGELHSTTLEVTMDSFFSGVQIHFTIDLPDKHLHKQHGGVINVHDGGLLPLSAAIPGGWDGMRAGTA